MKRRPIAYPSQFAKNRHLQLRSKKLAIALVGPQSREGPFLRNRSRERTSALQIVAPQEVPWYCHVPNWSANKVRTSPGTNRIGNSFVWEIRKNTWEEQ